jgi:tetratricopeptide (TPR) repeat protein
MTISQVQSKQAETQASQPRIRYQEERNWQRRLVDWVAERNPWHFLLGLPALGAAGTVAALAVSIALNQPEDRKHFYRELGRSAFVAQDHGLAALAYERLALLDAHDAVARYRWAVAADRLGQTALADALLEALAPADAIGYPPAHVWRAQRLLTGEPDMARVHAAEAQLRQALKAEPNRIEAHAVLGQLLLGSRRSAEALEHLLPALPFRPDLELAVAHIYAAQGQRNLAVTHARRAQEHYQPLAEGADDDPLPRLRWAEATLLTGATHAALTILEEGMRRKDHLAYHQALGDTYLACFDALAGDSSADLGTRLELLTQALRYAPGNVAALGRLLALSRAQGQDGERASAVLQNQLAQGKAAGTIHLLLGMQARAQKNPAQARLHFERAYELQPELGVVVNNLAWALAHVDPPDLPQALHLIDSALARWPQHPSFRETRGQILARQGRWREALADLEAVLPHLSKNAELHATLAKVYQELGLPDLAQEHERLAAAVPPP